MLADDLLLLDLERGRLARLGGDGEAVSERVFSVGFSGAMSFQLASIGSSMSTVLVLASEFFTV